MCIEEHFISDTMARKKVALLMTVGTGIGEDKEKARAGLANAMLRSIISRNPDIIKFFGSEESKCTVRTLKDLYQTTFDEELDFYEFIQIDEIDSFKKYFSTIKEYVNDLEEEYYIVIDYTYGTKTMTMSAAMVSMACRKELIFVSGERENGIVVKGSEQVQNQNLFPIYDSLLLEKIKDAFNANRFETAKSLLSELVDPKINKEAYYKLISTYSYFDDVNYVEAYNSFDFKLFSKEWPDLSDGFQKNIKSLKILNKETQSQKIYYVLASLINNARRRYEENKFDDAIARLYRSLELIGQIKLEEYGFDSSDIDLDRLKELDIDEKFISSLKSLRASDGKIKIGLIRDFELISYFDDDLATFYAENNKRIQNIVKFRNSSILAHGMEAKTADEYEEFKDMVLKAANILNPKIDEYIEDTSFPEF